MSLPRHFVGYFWDSDAARRKYGMHHVGALLVQHRQAWLKRISAANTWTRNWRKKTQTKKKTKKMMLYVSGILFRLEHHWAGAEVQWCADKGQFLPDSPPTTSICTRSFTSTVCLASLIFFQGKYFPSLTDPVTGTQPIRTILSRWYPRVSVTYICNTYQNSKPILFSLTRLLHWCNFNTSSNPSLQLKGE